MNWAKTEFRKKQPYGNTTNPRASLTRHIELQISVVIIITHQFPFM